MNSGCNIPLQNLDQKAELIVPGSASLTAGVEFKISVNVGNDSLNEGIHLILEGQSFRTRIENTKEKAIVIKSYGKHTLVVQKNGRPLDSKEVVIKPYGGILNDYFEFEQPYDALLEMDKDHPELIVLQKGGILSYRLPNGPSQQTYDSGVSNPFAIARYEKFYFVTFQRDPKVVKFTKSFKPEHVIRHKELSAPTGIATTDKGKCIFVANSDMCNAAMTCIFVFNINSNTFLRKIKGSLTNPWFIKLNTHNKLVVSDQQSVKVYNTEKHYLEENFIIPEIDGQIMKCTGLDVDERNNVFVALRGEGFRTQFECVAVYTEDFKIIDKICQSLPESLGRKRFFRAIGAIGPHLDSVVEDTIDRPSARKVFHFIRGLTLTKYFGDPVLIVVDAGNQTIRMISLVFPVS